MNKKELLSLPHVKEVVTIFGSAIIQSLPEDTEISAEMLAAALQLNKEYPPNFSQTEIELYTQGFDEAYELLTALLGFEQE